MPSSVVVMSRRGCRRMLLLALGASAVACRDGTTPPLELLTLSVGPYQVPCVGAFPTTCLLVRRLPDTRDELFYDGIRGFVFEPGYRQVIRVRVLRIADPLQDASSLAYVLVRVLERRQEVAID